MTSSSSSLGTGKDAFLGPKEGACPAPPGSPDEGVPWHYGDPLREQRELVSGTAVVDLSHRGVIRISGPDRLSWLHSLTTQAVDRLPAGRSALNLILSPHGHVEHELHGVEDGTSLWLSVEPATATALVGYLRSMQFMLRVEVEDVSADYAVIGDLRGEGASDEGGPIYVAPPEFAGTGTSQAGRDRGGDASKYVTSRPAAFPARERILPRAAAAEVLGENGLAGTWAWEALRVAAAVPRFGFETDHRTLPHEVGWIGAAVHLSKGCYRGQETVARVHNLGRPPRRLVLLHLDGSEGLVVGHGDEVSIDGRVVGLVGSVAQHYELGPIATAVIKRSTASDAVLTVATSEGQVSASQETVVQA